MSSRLRSFAICSLPAELTAELATAGLRETTVVGVEGPAGAWARLDPSINDAALDIARAAGTALAGVSIHLLARGVKPAG